MKRLFLVVVTTLACAGAVAVSKADAPEFHLFDVTANGTNASVRQIAVSANGEMVVGWVTGDSDFRVALRAPGHGFSPSVDLGQGVVSPLVAIDATGDALVGWTDAVGTTQVASSTAGGPFGTPTQMTGALSALAENLGGDAIVLLAKKAGTTYALSDERRTGKTGSFGAPQSIASYNADPYDTGSSGSPSQVAINSSGDAAALWSDERSGDEFAARLPAGASPGAPVALAVPSYRQIAIDAAGNFTIPHVGSASLVATTFHADGTPATDRVVFEEDASHQVYSEKDFQIVGDAAGDLTAIMRDAFIDQYGVDGSRIRIATAASGGAFSAQTLAEKDSLGALEGSCVGAAETAAGDALVAYCAVGSTPGIKVATRAAGTGTFSDPFTVSFESGGAEFTTALGSLSTATVVTEALHGASTDTVGTPESATADPTATVSPTATSTATPSPVVAASATPSPTPYATVSATPPATPTPSPKTADKQAITSGLEELPGTTTAASGEKAVTVTTPAAAFPDGSRITASLTAAKSALASVAVEKRSSIGSGHGTAHRGKATRIKITLSRKARATLRTRHKLKARLTVTVRAPGGAMGSRSAALTIKHR